MAGHSGNKWNDYVDELAARGRQGGRGNTFTPSIHRISFPCWIMFFFDVEEIRLHVSLPSKQGSSEKRLRFGGKVI